MVQWQQVIVVAVGGVPYQLTHDETRGVIRWLRESNPHMPTADLGSIAAAVFLERLLESPSAETPPLNDEEAHGILLALGRMQIKEGLTSRQLDLHDALFAHFAHREG